MSSGTKEEKKVASENKGEEEEEEEEASKEEGDDESGGGGDEEEEEEEYLPAEERKKRDSASAAAAKKGKDGAGSADAGNAEYDDKMEADRCKRFDFLLKQTEIFGHFMQEAGEKRAALLTAALSPV